MEPTSIKIPAELFALAESSRFEGDLDLDALDANPDEYRFDAPLAWWVDVTNTGEALLVAGSVEGRAITSCARCLADVPFDLQGDIEGYFLIDPEKSAPEDLDDDEVDVLPADHIIDLEPLIRAALLMEIPFVPLCREDCKGLCSQCGADLNEGPCSCGVSDFDREFDRARNPFSVLEGLHLDADE